MLSILIRDEVNVTQRFGRKETVYRRMSHDLKGSVKRDDDDK
jgi:hypothetical protein